MILFSVIRRNQCRHLTFNIGGGWGVVARWYVCDVITHRGLNAAGLWTTSKEWQNILKVRVGVLHYITGNDYSTLMKMHYTVLYYTVLH